ncbi:phosphatidate cytidylyltransferase [candidate division KSB1 bacterium]|nr:phosphatidate cytidylyltransferase [candidate division KSB1 bacterium]
MKLSTFIKRAIVALAAGPLILLTVFKGGYYTLFFVAALSLLSQLEYLKLVRAKDIYGQLPSVILSVFIFQMGLFFWREKAVLPVLLFGLIFTTVYELFRVKGSAILNAAATCFGIVYFNLCLGSLILIRQLPKTVNIDDAVAGKWIVMVILAVWVCDSMAYIIGSLAGKHRLWQRISPKKTIEGTIAGLLSTLLFVTLCHFWFLDVFSLTDTIIIGILIVIFSTLGDLFESLLKRDARIKDSSQLIPGHGGILDRFDGMTMVLPVIYLYIRFVVF